MKKKILGILGSILLIVTIVPTVQSIDDNIYTSVFLHSYTQSCSRDDWTEIQKLIASDPEYQAVFGCSVSIDGDTALIGAYGVDETGWEIGAAYVFIRSDDTWTQQAKLLASDGETQDFFGNSVSLSQNTALIGAYGSNSDQGAAYVFTRSGTSWTQQTKLVAIDGASFDWFGFSVSLDGDTALIGAIFDDDKGSAYVFTRAGTTWIQQAKLLASDGASLDQFGESVSLNGDTALIGASWDDENGDQSGSAYVFTRSGTSWTQQAKLFSSDGAESDFFGKSVSVSQDTALVGADKNDENGDQSGAAYVFTRAGTTWTQQAKLLASDGMVGDNFGAGVNVVGDTVIIGATGYNNNQGAAYIFTRTGNSWSQQAKILASDGAQGDSFGTSLSTDENTAIIGSPANEIYGSTYVFIKQDTNQPPSTPTISGPSTGKPGQELTFVFNSVDPDGDNVRFIIDWGDTTYDTTDYITSGTDKSVSHIWDSAAKYYIVVRAEDSFGNISPQAIKQITILRNKIINTPLQNWLQNHPNLFQIIQRLLQQLDVV